VTKDLPWLIGIFGAVVFFAIFEARAIWHPDRQNTLSRFIYNIFHGRTITVYFAGLFTALLIVHLFAYWC